VTLVIGHRGAPGYRPEHTRSSYELAIAMGVDAVEPDVVFSRDGVLVVRHENEISTTTDVAEHPEFSDRRTVKVIDGERLEGWFTEDFTWDELATLRCRERLPALRPDSAAYDDVEPPLRLTDLLALVAEAPREVTVVVEIKHAAYFAGLGFDVAAAVAEQSKTAAPLIFESFEPTVLDRLRERGVPGARVFLLDDAGSPADLVARDGAAAPTYARMATPAGFDELAGRMDGISVAKGMVLDERSTVVADAHQRGLRVFTWTCRPENTFLAARFRRAGDPAAFGDYRAEWAVLKESGVDGVFADHPDLAGAFFH
jgi:glycerophosphoryl diester phosphodiesterase